MDVCSCWQHCPVVLAITIRQKKEIHIGKAGVKLSLFSDNMIIYIKKYDEIYKIPTELISRISKTIGHRINI